MSENKQRTASRSSSKLTQAVAKTFPGEFMGIYALDEAGKPVFLHIWVDRPMLVRGRLLIVSREEWLAAGGIVPPPEESIDG